MKSKDLVRENVTNLVNAGAPANEVADYVNAEGYSLGEIGSLSDDIKGYLFKGLQGVTLGNADEAVGLVESLNPFDDKTYTQNRDRVRTAEALFDKANPVSSTVTEMGGGLLTGVNRLAGTNSIGGLAKEGGILGLLGGYGYSDSDSLGGQATDTVLGGLTGTAMGAATMPLMNAVKGLAYPVYQPIINKLSGKNPGKVQRDVIRDIQADGMSVDEVMARLEQMGGDAIIPDAAGANTMSLAKHAAETPGPGVQAAEKFLTTRDLGQGSRLSQAAAQITGKDANYYDEIDRLILKRAEDSKPLYDEFVNDLSNQVDMGQLANFLKDSPFLLNQFEKVAKDQTWGVSNLQPSSIKFIDAVKKSLDDMQGNLSNPTNQQKNKANLVNKSLRKLRDFADQAVPGYADARKAYEIPSKQMELMENGRKFMRGDSEVIARDVKKMTPEEKEYFLAGVIRQIDDTLKSASDNADMTKRIFGSQKKRDAIKAAFDNDEMFERFEEVIRTESRMNKTKQTILGNSATYKNLAKAQQSNPSLLDAGLDMAQGSPINAAINGARAYLGKMGAGYTDDQLAELARVLYTPQRDIMRNGLNRELGRTQGLLSLQNMTGNLIKGGLLGGGSTQAIPAVHGLLR